MNGTCIKVSSLFQGHSINVLWIYAATLLLEWDWVNLDRYGLNLFPMQTVSKEHISITPGVCGGKPTIVGHRIRVQDIVISHEFLGMSPDQIVSAHPSITLADVHAALVYYYDHIDEIRRDLEEEERFVSELQIQTPSLLQQKLKEKHGPPAD
jgi:uncharacterized protein (DUF433 family)